MLMVKEECANAVKLFRLKLKFGKIFRWPLLVAAILFFGRLLPIVYSVLYDNNIDLMTHTITDYSTTFFFGMSIVYLIAMLTYRQQNDYLSVFPQTNTGRFVATQLLLNTLALVTVSISLALYLLTYGSLKALSLFSNNIYFALNFDIGFNIVGFLTYIVYSFLIIAVFGLIGTVLRKWRFFAAAAFIALLSLIIVNLQWVFEHFPKIFTFIINEPIPALFFLKGIALWLVLTAVSLVINYYTVYHQSHKKVTTFSVVAICVIIAAMIVPAIILINTAESSSGVMSTHEIQAEELRHYEAGFTEIPIDISHLPKGSSLNIEGENILVPERNVSYQLSRYEMIVNDPAPLSDLTGDTLVISYRFPNWEINGFDLYGYTNPELTVYLDGDTLRIDYTYDNAHVILMPIWRFAGQFECYKDKDLLPRTPWGYSSGGGGSGYINFRVE